MKTGSNIHVVAGKDALDWNENPYDLNKDFNPGFGSFDEATKSELLLE
jgi:hypothetical protein